MSDLRRLFVEAVSSEFMKRMKASGDDVPHTVDALDKNINLCLKTMAELERQGQAFEMQAYSEEVLEQLGEVSDGQAILGVFSEYCYFQSMVLVLKEFPGLLTRFRKAGLESWTKLQVDKSTLRPFSLEVVERLEVGLLPEAQLSPEEKIQAADFIFQTSDLFDIPISFQVRAMLDWCLAERSDMQDDGSQVEQRKVLN